MNAKQLPGVDNGDHENKQRNNDRKQQRVL